MPISVNVIKDGKFTRAAREIMQMRVATAEMPAAARGKG
jgi:hypothetical protein